MKCNFCKKIYSFKKAMEWKEDYAWYNNYEDYNIIVRNDNDFKLWTRCDDNYYTGMVMTINYCPKCGRKLAGAGSNPVQP